jgi:hypothetical protein
MEPEKNKKKNPAAGLPKKKETYAPRPPGQPGDPKTYTPIPEELKQKRGPKPRGGLFVKKTPKKGPRVLPELSLTRVEYGEVFRTVDDIEKAVEGFRVVCEERGDMPTLIGFCLFCGGDGSLLRGYIEGQDKRLSHAAQAVSDWIVEQMDQAVVSGQCPVSYAQHLAVNQHGRYNSRSYSEGHNRTEVTGEYTIGSLIEQADKGGLPAPPSMKRLPASAVRLPSPVTASEKARDQVIEMAPVQNTKGHSRPGSKAAVTEKD